MSISGEWLWLQTLVFASLTALFSQIVVAQSLYDELELVNKGVNSGIGLRVMLMPGLLHQLGLYSQQQLNNYLRNSGNHHLKGKLDESNDFEINNLRFKTFNEDSYLSEFKLEPGYDGLIWKVKNLTIDAVAEYSTDYKVAKGTMDITIFNLNAHFILTMDVGEEGSLHPQMIDCRVFISTVDLTFSQGDVLNMVEQTIERMAKNALQQYLCHVMNNELMPTLQSKLLTLPQSAHLFDAFYLNFKLLEKPNFRPAGISTAQSGAVFALLNDGTNIVADHMLPFEAEPFDIPDASTRNKHIHMYMNNHTLGSLLYWMDQFQMFDYEFSQTSKKAGAFKEYLLTTCDSLCAGTIYPSLSVAHPNSAIEVHVSTVTHPNVIVDGDVIRSYSTARVDGYVTPIDGDDLRQTFITAFVDFELTVKKIKVTEDLVLSAELKVDKHTLRDLESPYSDITVDSVEFLVDTMVDLTVSKDFKNLLGDGIQLPKFTDLKLYKPSVNVNDGLMEVSAYLCAPHIQDCDDVIAKQLAKERIIKLPNNGFGVINPSSQDNQEQPVETATLPPDDVKEATTQDYYDYKIDYEKYDGVFASS